MDKHVVVMKLRLSQRIGQSLAWFALAASFEFVPFVFYNKDVHNQHGASVSFWWIFFVSQITFAGLSFFSWRGFSGKPIVIFDDEGVSMSKSTILWAHCNKIKVTSIIGKGRTWGVGIWTSPQYNGGFYGRYMFIPDEYPLRRVELAAELTRRWQAATPQPANPI